MYADNCDGPSRPVWLPNSSTLPHVKEWHQEPARVVTVDVVLGEKPTESPVALEEQQSLKATNKNTLNFLEE